MISADSSSLIAYLEGEISWDTEAIERAIDAVELVLAPPVLVELIGRISSVAAYDAIAANAALLPLSPGYWHRARATRALVLSKGLRARALDSLIAQCCIDSDVELIARDSDFRHFARWCDLKLVAAS